MTNDHNERAARVASAVFPLLWKAECYNGITLRDVDDCRIGGRLDMGGRVERYEKQAEDIAQAATAVLAREFEADRARIEALEAELSRLKRGEWFYLAGDMSSDKCRFSPYEVIDEDWLYDNRGEGDRVIEIEVATPLPSIWCAVHFFSNEEKDARQSDDAYEFTEHATEEAARAALKDTNA